MPSHASTFNLSGYWVLGVCFSFVFRYAPLHDWFKMYSLHLFFFFFSPSLCGLYSDFKMSIILVLSFLLLLFVSFIFIYYLFKEQGMCIPIWSQTPCTAKDGLGLLILLLHLSTGITGMCQCAQFMLFWGLNPHLFQGIGHSLPDWATFPFFLSLFKILFLIFFWGGEWIRP